MTAKSVEVIYWDASAVLSTLFHDRHSDLATAWIQDPHVHLLSSLASAEVFAVIGRLGRERRLAPILIEAARETFASGPWRSIHDTPDPTWLRRLSKAWPLRGADLWHLAMAKTLQSDLPELVLLTYDQQLATAAQGEGLSP